jgi:hypothetical protein
MNGPPILVVTGVSGAGKTAAVRALEKRALPNIRCFFFDDIGIPSVEVMVRDHGGPEAWQAEATKRWIARLVSDGARDVASVLDGQTRPSFVRAALASWPSVRGQILLFECEAAVRAVRLTARGQPELANMETWAAYLRGQADALELPVVDTTRLTIEAAADALERQVSLLLSR